ncbi:acetylornithine deacetylase [Rhizobium lusitanum]|uniref:Acetylornithine deacetylase n=1 Tax=Rhizobium lusitanum TaxID=293958 RepID=A0A6L9UDG7_9HYPH|nr:acetylornithine deacetylase [Rhizobium lusitanum]NEI74015.1 acetylornithine deacetylase [Rhizobium lusitanum]
MMQDRNTLSILERLVSFPSVSRDSNLDIAEYVAMFAIECGGRVERFPSQDGVKEALLLAFGPSVEGGVVLSGHMDVVPVDDQVWTSDPFRLRQADQRLYGRGAVDMKGFLAIALATAGAVNLKRLSKPLYLAFSYDEETTCQGVRPVVEHIRRSVPTPAAVIVGEPTEMRLVGAHKGAVDWSVRVRGKAAHSSRPHLGANAIHAAAHIIAEIDAIGRELQAKPSTLGELFDVSYPTVCVGRIEGGTAGNVIASECTFHLEMRPLEAGQDAYVAQRVLRFAETEIIPELKRTAPEASVTLTMLDSIPPLVRQPSSTAECLIGTLAGSDHVEAVSYVTEAGIFQSIGLPTVVFGPGSIEQAHQRDEYITMSQFREGENFFRKLAETLY